MAATIKLEIVTPEAKIFSGEADIVQLTGSDGEMGIMAGHMLLMTGLVAGEISYRLGSETTHMAVGDGFVQITHEKVSILTDMAIAADNIDEAKAQEALQRAQARLTQKINDEESASVQASIVNASAQLKLKRSNRK
jgi:F-type H+-transporting ATPase subunit epsilon